MALNGWFAKIAVVCIKGLVLLYDIASFPIYYFIDKPWKKWELKRIIWSKLQDPKDPYSCYVRQNHCERDLRSGIKTMDQLFMSAVTKYGDRQCYGVRKVFGEEEEKKGEKVLIKMNLGEYEWLTFNEVNQKVDDISKGLLSLGVRSKKPIILLAETRVEWVITAQACFRINVPVVTLYATLGEDGLVHGINQSEATYIVTSSDLLPKLKEILHRVPIITHVIYMESVTGKKVSTDGIPERVNVIPYSQLEENGKQFTDASYTPPSSDDLAILMYTSGSTGVPKGVMITHKNVVTCVAGFDNILIHPSFEFGDKDTYIAYLPVAHVLELAAECYITSLGIRVGFSSPQTLTDFSTAIKRGEKGDLKVLKPTLMVSVPLMLDRVRKSILHLAGKEGTFTRLMFDFAISYKKFWSEKGFQTPRLDRKLLRTYRDFMGGEIRVIMCGSAPLSPDTQSFIRACLNVHVLQGYGLTESAACASVMSLDDCSTGRVGAPLSTCKLRLVDWEEGNYHVTDKPNPRGEIVLGGDSLTLGYFKNPEQTQEAFKFEGGDRWFYTGDIGEVFPDGTLKIIDRKKDLVKLQFGEYIALGKVEAELKTYPLIENICVVGSGLHTYLIALVLPNQLHLTSLAKEIGKENLSFKEMCADKEITQEAGKRIREFGKSCHLFGSELPKKIKLFSDEWSPESGLVTAAFKLRRKYVEQRYQEEIKSMYAEPLQNGPSSI